MAGESRAYQNDRDAAVGGRSGKAALCSDASLETSLTGVTGDFHASECAPFRCSELLDQRVADTHLDPRDPSMVRPFKSRRDKRFGAGRRVDGGLKRRFPKDFWPDND